MNAIVLLEFELAHDDVVVQSFCHNATGTCSNTGKSPGELRRLAVLLDLNEEHQLLMVLKTHKSKIETNYAYVSLIYTYIYTNTHTHTHTHTHIYIYIYREREREREKERVQ